ncbi:type II toxin-antitoxin system PemK/MazF family toxin [Enterococcus sp. LJL99]
MVFKYKGYLPNQGDIIQINFNPSAGREIQKRRPAIVISSHYYNGSTGFVAVCPITSTNKANFIPLDRSHVTHGYINPLQIKTLDFISKQRDIHFIEKATTAELGQTAQIVSMIFDFQNLIGT